MKVEVDIDAIMQWLDRGDVNRLAELEGITPRTASSYIHGKPGRKKFSFINRLTEEAERNMRLAERTQALRNNLTLLQ